MAARSVRNRGLHHIITDGTVDNHVLKALQSKEKTQNSLIAAVKAELYK